MDSTKARATTQISCTLPATVAWNASAKDERLCADTFCLRPRDPQQPTDQVEPQKKKGINRNKKKHIEALRSLKRNECSKPQSNLCTRPIYSPHKSTRTPPTHDIAALQEINCFKACHTNATYAHARGCNHMRHNMRQACDILFRFRFTLPPSATHIRLTPAANELSQRNTCGGISSPEFVPQRNTSSGADNSEDSAGPLND